MLNFLDIKGLAIIDRARIPFAPGLNVVSGETGSGKSIILDALALVLGRRASASLLKRGCEQAQVTALFSIGETHPAQPEVKRWCEELAIESDGEIEIRRVLNADGKSKAWVNGVHVSLSALEGLGAAILDVSSQFQSQRFLQREIQRELLDHYAGLLPNVSMYQAAYVRYRAAQDFLKIREAELLSRQQESDFLNAKRRDAELLDYQAGELTAIKEEILLLHNAERISSSCRQTESSLYAGDNSIYDQLAAIARSLRDCRSEHGLLAEAPGKIEEMQALAAELAQNMASFVQNLEFPEERLREAEERQEAIFHFMRKYDVREENLQAVLTELTQGSTATESLEQEVAQLRLGIATMYEALRTQAMEIHQKRVLHAPELAVELISHLADLQLPRAVLEVAVSLAESAGLLQLGPKGVSDVAWLFSANPGSPPLSLDKVISGGELSRLFLAVKAVQARRGGASTLVVDEIDAGLGGTSAALVGDKLKEMAGTMQVICITHSPHVASKANHHLVVTKLHEATTTAWSISALTGDERTAELARMLGGKQISERSRELAKELLKN